MYAFCRYVDDIVDVAVEEQGLTVDDAIHLVERWRSDVTSLYERGNDQTVSSRESAAVLRAWEDVLARYHIPRSLPETLIDGVLMDTMVTRFQTFDELREYCYKVASVVGLMTTEIFGYSNPAARDHAVDLGIAMQLTNIIRDVKEDAERGRIYLPLDELFALQLTEDDVLKQRWSSAVASLIQVYVQKADAYYESANLGISMLHPNSRVTVRLMSANYRKILRVVERMNYNVFLGRAHTTFWEKLVEVPRALFALP